MAERILIIGGGQVGSGLIDALRDRNVDIWREDIDALSRVSLSDLNPDAVINAAGKTDLAWCEANARETVRSNIEAPVQLYDRILDYSASRVKPVRFLHFSSGCVWDGPFRKDGAGFEPNDPPSPACLYSWTKAAADGMLLQRDSEHVAILRPRQIYSASSTPRNSIVKLLRYPKLIDSPNSMSSLEIIQQTVRTLLDAATNWSGIWNIYDDGAITPYEVGVMLAEAGLREMPTSIKKSELDTWHVPRRVDTVLSDKRFEALIHPEPLTVVMKRTILAFKDRLDSEPS